MARSHFARFVRVLTHSIRSQSPGLIIGDQGMTTARGARPEAADWPILPSDWWMR